MPTVVLEAMSAGLPTVAFEDGGGTPDLLRECQAGAAVPLGDAAAMVRQMRALLQHARPATRRRLAAQARTLFDFDRYVARLLALACPAIPQVSAVVPSYDYAHFLPRRLETIFAQNHPVAEVVVLDDASTDDSEAVVRQVAAAAGRRVRWIGSARNGGSVFRQWRLAARLASSDWIWIAEADDASEPGFLSALGAALAGVPDAVMAFSDSRAVDAAGEPLWPDHQAYYAESGAGLLAEDGVFEAAEVLRRCLGARNLVLNVSAVLFRREALLAALDRCGPALDAFDMAGDWRLYAELLAGGGKVAYVARPLNVHRRHAASVTHRLPPTRHLDEVARMQRHMRELLGDAPGLAARQHAALQSARQALQFGPAARKRTAKRPARTVRNGSQGGLDQRLAP